MFGRTSHNDNIPAASYRKAKDVVFLELRDTVFCTECELISYNNSPRCLACGSQSVLSLARVLGGSLQGEQRARVVRSAADTIEAPGPRLVPKRPPEWDTQFEPAYALAMQNTGSAVSMLQFSVDRTCALTEASGGAVAMKDGDRLLCRATAGATAPDVGAVVPPDGVTALCARTGQLWRCHDTDREPWVNRDSCRRLGIRSIVVAPVLALRKVIGILEVFSPARAAFSDDHAATVQLMASAIALATLRNTNHRLESTPGE